MASAIRAIACIGFSFLIFAGTVTAAGIDAPTIIDLRQSAPYGQPERPIITGLTVKNTDVLVYANGSFLGEAKVTEIRTGTNSFVFQPSRPMASGDYRIELIARDRTSSVLSAFAPARSITIPGVGTVDSGNGSPTVVPAPTIVSPNIKTVTGAAKPLITGLTVSGTRLHVIIDGRANGHTAILRHPSGTANFAYRPFLNLGVGEHTVQVIAEDAQGRTGRASAVSRFRIERPLPAPVLAAPRAGIVAGKPVIVGNAKNGLTIRIFIDKKFAGNAVLTDDRTGTGHFAFHPSRTLTPGSHLVYAVAVDRRGKESRWSNQQTVAVRRPAITAAAANDKITVKPIERNEAEIRATQLLAKARVFEATDRVELSDEDKADLTDIINGTVTVKLTAAERASLVALLRGAESPDKPVTTPDSRATTTDPDLAEILGRAIATATDSGLINEAKERQGRLNTNLIVFLLFLAAVIVWIFWVNRELIKERRAKEEDRPNRFEP